MFAVLHYSDFQTNFLNLLFIFYLRNSHCAIFLVTSSKDRLVHLTIGALPEFFGEFILHSWVAILEFHILHQQGEIFATRVILKVRVEIIVFEHLLELARKSFHSIRGCWVRLIIYNIFELLQHAYYDKNLSVCLWIDSKIILGKLFQEAVHKLILLLGSQSRRQFSTYLS